MIRPQDRERVYVLKAAVLQYVRPMKSFVREAGFLKYTPGGMVARQMMCVDSIQSEFSESVTNHRAGCLRGIPTPPVWKADPVAKLSASVRKFESKADRADEGPV
jgi:hypothetical protein